MVARRARKRSRNAVAVPEGLQIENDRQFYKDVCSALAKSLGANHLGVVEKEIGQRKLVYIREPSSPSVQGREGRSPVLPIFVDESQSAWLVVELESEYGQPLMLKHVSLKLWQGLTLDAAHLSFRAEWDVRDANCSHAQPHWNVHASRAIDDYSTTEVNFKAFSDREAKEEVSTFSQFLEAEEEREGPSMPSPTPADGLMEKRLHKFHFAMSSDWHVRDSRDGPAISTTEEIVAWIGSCALYIKRQFAFVMGS